MSDDQNQQPSEELIEQCHRDIHKAMSSAVKHLFDDEQNGGEFFAHILASMRRDYTDKRIPTAAVSVTNSINLYVNPYFFVHKIAQEVKDENGKVIQPALDLSTPAGRQALQAKRAAIIKHEILHCIFHHMSRGQDFGNPQLANIAADMVVNSCIEKSVLGNQFIYPQDFNLPKDKSLDFYYSNYPIEDNPICERPSEHDKQYKQQQGGQGNSDSSKDQDGDQQDQSEGQEDGGHDHAVDANGKCKQCGGQRTFDNHDVWTEDGTEHMSDAMKDSLIKDAINRAAEATKNAGNLPNSIQEMIALAKRKPQIPWQRILKQFVSKISGSRLYHTKKRPSKRFKTYPGTKIYPVLKLGVGVDVSGSISDPEYEIFLNEIFSIARAIGGEVEVVEWDTQVQGTYKLRGYKPNVTRTGRGGTDPREAIEYFNQRKNKFDGVIMFTDGYLFGDLDKAFRIPSLWVVTADGTKECLKKSRVIQLPKTESEVA